jgi:hypothetical protein
MRTGIVPVTPGIIRWSSLCLARPVVMTYELNENSDDDF